MENRKPLDLKLVLIIYNFSVVALSVYMIYEVSQCTADGLFLFGFFHRECEMHTLLAILLLYFVL